MDDFRFDFAKMKRNIQICRKIICTTQNLYHFENTTYKQHCLSSSTKNGNLNSVENSNILTVSSLRSTVVDHAVFTIKVSKYKNQKNRETNDFALLPRHTEKDSASAGKNQNWLLSYTSLVPFNQLANPLSLETVLLSGEVLNSSSFCFISRRSSLSSSLKNNKKTRWPPAKM